MHLQRGKRPTERKALLWFTPSSFVDIYICNVCNVMYRVFDIAPLVSNVPQKLWFFWQYAAVLTPYRVMTDTTTQSSTVQPTPG